MPFVYTAGRGLGDNWYTLNTLLRNKEGELRVSTRLSAQTKPNLKVQRRLEEILSVLNAPTDRVVLTDEHPMNYKRGFFDGNWDTKYFPTKRVWTPNTNATICYQFDAYFLKKAQGLPDPNVLFDALTLLTSRYKLVRLGIHCSLEEACETLSKSLCFVGVSSGFSHVAHSVGVPMCLIEGSQKIARYHKGKQYTLAHSAEQVLTFAHQLANSHS